MERLFPERLRDFIHGENDFAEKFKNIAKYRKNNFVNPSKFLGRTLKLIARM